MTPLFTLIAASVLAVGTPASAPVIVLPAGTELTGANAGYRLGQRLELTPGDPPRLVPLRPSSTPSLSDDRKDLP